MADKKFTLLEVNLGDGNVQFGPKSIDTGGSSEAEPEFEADEALELDDETESSGSMNPLPFVVGLLVLVVGIAVAVKKFTGGGDFDELEELDELAAEA